ncbi:MAG: flagellar hook-basal body complex protein FliE [Oscillospiraceae bacterium]|nr:flagellar hook-basal body complex protein FliE [Oscillospiraceae bacterium]
MTINPLAGNLVNLLTPNPAISFDTGNRQGMTQQPDISFSNVLSDAFASATHADIADRTSGLELLMGQSDDLSGLMLDIQKAELSLSLAIQIRNRIVDSYNEIMRMQV